LLSQFQLKKKSDQIKSNLLDSISLSFNALVQFNALIQFNFQSLDSETGSLSMILSSTIFVTDSFDKSQLFNYVIERGVTFFFGE